jgi:hypothetical protein
VQIATLNALASFITAEGSSIRELAPARWTAAANQSLAEATLPPGSEPLVLLCCAPAYSHDDTVMTGR